MTKNTHGGKRLGAGRPQGRKNAATLADAAVMATLPATNEPMQWLLNVMRCENLTPRRRLQAAAALLPYVHAKM